MLLIKNIEHTTALQRYKVQQRIICDDNSCHDNAIYRHEKYEGGRR